MAHYAHCIKRQLTEKRCGSSSREVGRALGVGSGERNLFFNFQVKMQGFMHFYCAKLHLWPEAGTRGLNRLPWDLNL